MARLRATTAVAGPVCRPGGGPAGALHEKGGGVYYRETPEPVWACRSRAEWPFEPPGVLCGPGRRGTSWQYERGSDVSFANCGLPYYLGGLITSRQRLLMSSPERFRDLLRIEVRTRHEVRSIDRQRKVIREQNLRTGQEREEPYDVLVLTTGAAPVRPALPGIDLPGVFSLRTLDDADAIRAWIEQHKPLRAVVVGGGYIGLEMVENLCLISAWKW